MIEINQLYNCEWQDLVLKIPDNSVDLILTDPPYESLRKWEDLRMNNRMGLGQKGTKTYNPDKFFDTIYNSELPSLLKQLYRVLKPQRHAYIMCDFETLFLLYRSIIDENIFPPVGYAGKVLSFKPLIWDKIRPGMGYTYRATYEFILMLWKGKKRQLADYSIQDILRFKRIPPTRAIVPTQKPVELFEVLIKQSTKEKELVLDLFMGSGTTAIAASKNNRNWIGCEKSESNFKKAKKRIQEESKVIELFSTP
jgi:site-specific DNA-methyltransferase (adenine-specific)